MASTEPKTTVKYSGPFDLNNTIKKDEFKETANFSAPNSLTSFNLRLTEKGQLTLHLATCWQEKLHIDSFDVVATKKYSIETIRHSLSGDISLNGDTQLCCSLSDDSVGLWRRFNPWNINCIITYEEPSVKTDHKKKLNDQLMALRRNSEHSDVTLVTMADGVEHPAHKCILSMRSPVFSAMFKYEGMVENVLNRVEIEGVKSEVMKVFLDYVYSGDISSVHWFAAELFELANKYDVPPLAQASVKAITVANAAQLYYLADLHQQVNYKRMVMRFISTNMRAVKNTNGWSEFVEPYAKLLNQLFDYI